MPSARGRWRHRCWSSGRSRPAEARATMLQPEDVADAVVFVATLPQRANVELLTMYPTEQRDWTAETDEPQGDQADQGLRRPRDRHPGPGADGGVLPGHPRLHRHGRVGVDRRHHAPPRVRDQPHQARAAGHAAARGGASRWRRRGDRLPVLDHLRARTSPRCCEPARRPAGPVVLPPTVARPVSPWRWSRTRTATGWSSCSPTRPEPAPAPAPRSPVQPGQDAAAHDGLDVGGGEEVQLLAERRTRSG